MYAKCPKHSFEEVFVCVVYLFSLFVCNVLMSIFYGHSVSSRVRRLLCNAKPRVYLCTRV